jgi:NAD(P)-dependent dehydrogenase (short-subunit alcohol dehydrogenase family)
MSALEQIAGRRPKLFGTVAVVTGGSSGLGRACALALATAGAHVVVVGRDQQRVAQASREVGGLGLVLDVTSETEMAELAARTLDAFGRIDILLAAAGIGAAPGAGLPRPVAATPLRDWQAVLRTNLGGVFLSNRAVLPAMLAAGSGHIVNVASFPAGVGGTPLAAAYCASKHGVAGLSEALAAEVAPAGVRVDVLFPGLLATPMAAGPLLARRFGVPLPTSLVADFVVFLATQPADVRMPTTCATGYPALRRLADTAPTTHQHEPSERR